MDPVPAKTAKPVRPLAQNRRRGNRHRLDIPASLITDGETSTEIAIIVTEMSVGGIGFRCTQSLQLNATYRVSSFDTLIPQGMRAAIVTQRQLPDGNFEVGAKTI